jgi:hypothetical protein
VALDAAVHPAPGPARGAWQHLSHGFQLSGSLQYDSALPFNVVTGGNTVQGTSARPVLANGDILGRNAGTGFDFLGVNARITRSFALHEGVRLEAIVEAFNALNHRNDLIPNGTFGTGLYPANPLPPFGHATAVGDPRTMQAAVRVTF